MTAIAGTVDTTQDHLLRDRLAVVCPAQPHKEINNGSGGVQRVTAQLGRLVVVREHVVVIVPTFAQRCHGDHKVLSRADVSDKVYLKNFKNQCTQKQKYLGISSKSKMLLGILNSHMHLKMFLKVYKRVF